VLPGVSATSKQNQETQTISTTLTTPVFVVGAPRTGVTLVTETLANNRLFWLTERSSLNPIDGNEALNATNRHYASECLNASDVTDDIKAMLPNAILRKLQNKDSGPLASQSPDSRPDTIRWLDGTLSNSLRISFLKSLFPDARFIHITRDIKPTMSSIMEGWKSGLHITHRHLPNWQHDHHWSYVLPPQWESVSGKSLEEIAFFQYTRTTQVIDDALSDLSEEDVYTLRYEDFVEHHGREIKALCAFCDIPFGPKMQSLCELPTLPLSGKVIDAPEKDKWLKNQALIEAFS
jgi:hypothetical protein